MGGIGSADIPCDICQAPATQHCTWCNPDLGPEFGCDIIACEAHACSTSEPIRSYLGRWCDPETGLPTDWSGS